MRDAVAVKNGVLLQDLGSIPQHSHGGSQTSLTPVPGDPMHLSGFYRHRMHVIHEGQTAIHIKIKIKVKKIENPGWAW